jgi:hypothetical protein
MGARRKRVWRRFKRIVATIGFFKTLYDSAPPLWKAIALYGGGAMSSISSILAVFAGLPLWSVPFFAIAGLFCIPAILWASRELRRPIAIPDSLPAQTVAAVQKDAGYLASQISGSASLPTTAVAKEIAIGQIGFGYIVYTVGPHHGWIVNADDAGSKPKITPAGDTDIRDAVSIICEGRSYVQCELPDMPVEIVKVSVKPGGGTFYLFLRLVTCDRKRISYRCVYFDHGTGAPSINRRVNQEWRVPVDSLPDENGWHQWTSRIADDVRRTFGTEEIPLVYDKLVGIRIRGAMTLSPIKLLASV